MGNFKVHSSLLKASLLKGGVTHVFMGRHGMKQYLVEKTLADLATATLLYEPTVAQPTA